MQLRSCFAVHVLRLFIIPFYVVAICTLFVSLKLKLREIVARLNCCLFSHIGDFSLVRLK